MVQIKELRIGNFIGDGIEGFYEVSDINEVNMFEINDEPIPLTGEWLLKLRFINHSSFTFIKYFSLSKEYTHELEFFFEPNEKVCITFREFAISDRKERNIIFLENINYVHQLQNLYFALTSEELTLK